MISPVEFTIKADNTMAQPVPVGNLTAKVVESRVLFADKLTKEGLVGFSGGEIVLEASTLYIDSALDKACYLNVNLSPDKVPATLGRLDFSIEEYFLDSLSDMQGSQSTEDKRWMLIHMGIWEWKFDARPNVPDVRVWRRFFGLLVKEVSRGNEKIYERLGIVEARFRFQDVTDDFEFLASNEAFMREWKRETVRIV